MNGSTTWAGALAMVMAVGTVGCGEPLEGSWISLLEAQCAGGEDNVRFTVDSDLQGDGDVCDCDFEFIADPRGGGRYRLDLEFDGACSLFLDDGKWDCDLISDNDRLDCGDLGRYKRDE